MKTKINLLILTFFMLVFFSCKKEKYLNDEGSLVPKTVVDDATLPFITVKGAKLHSEAFGNPHNPLVIAIHGGPGSDYREMLSCKDLVEQGYRVVFYDQRGSGLSQRFDKEKYTDAGVSFLDTIYNELKGVIAHYKQVPSQKVYLIGHSWGAMLATAFTGKYPNMVDGLVVSEPGGLIWDDVVDYIKDSRSLNFFSETANDAMYYTQMISAKRDQHAIIDYKVALMVSKNTQTGEGVTEKISFWRHGGVINSAMIELGQKYEPSFASGIERFNKRVLFFYSENNKSYTDDWAKRISSYYKNVEKIKVSGVGHSGLVSNNEAWSKQVMPKILSYFTSL